MNFFYFVKFKRTVAQNENVDDQKRKNKNSNREKF